MRRQVLSVGQTAVILIALLALALGRANADPITISFTGSLGILSGSAANDAQWLADNSIVTGEALTGTIVYDPSLITTAGPADPGAAYYVGTSADAAMLTLQVGSETFTGNDPYITVESGQIDFAFNPTTLSPLWNNTPSCIGGMEYATGNNGGEYGFCAYVNLIYTSAQSGLSLPTSLPPLAADDLSDFAYYNTYNQLPGEGFYGALTGGSSSSTPEPASVLLFGSGLVGTALIWARLALRAKNG